jgi:hypothetical protein
MPRRLRPVCGHNLNLNLSINPVSPQWPTACVFLNVLRDEPAIHDPIIEIVNLVGGKTVVQPRDQIDFLPPR